MVGGKIPGDSPMRQPKGIFLIIPAMCVINVASLIVLNVRHYDRVKDSKVWWAFNVVEIAAVAALLALWIFGRKRIHRRDAEIAEKAQSDWNRDL